MIFWWQQHGTVDQYQLDRLRVTRKCALGDNVRSRLVHVQHIFQRRLSHFTLESLPPQLDCTNYRCAYGMLHRIAGKWPIAREEGEGEGLFSFNQPRGFHGISRQVATLHSPARRSIDEGKSQSDNSPLAEFHSFPVVCEPFCD